MASKRNRYYITMDVFRKTLGTHYKCLVAGPLSYDAAVMKFAEMKKNDSERKLEIIEYVRGLV